MPSRCDLHVHSRHSDRPSEWYLDRLGAPESFTEPLDVYRLARARGMDFVTIADHDTIAGALEIAHLPGAFASCEISAAFPEDGTQVHVLAWGLDEATHRETQEVRRDLYLLVGRLRERGIVHALAHPFFRVDDRLTVAQLERCLLLFDRFELLNGTRDPRATELFGALVAALDRDLIARLADRHRLEPGGAEPWRKTLVGGSDDHCGLYVGTTWTETSEATTTTEFLARLAAGDHRPGGEAGSSLKLARAFQALAHDYYRRKVLGGSRWRNDPLADLLRRFAAGEVDPAGAPGGAWAESLRRVTSLLPNLSGGRSSLSLARRAVGRAAESALAREEERAVFEGSARLAQRALARTLDAAAAALERGRPLAALPALSTLASGAVALSPYLAAFRFQHKDEEFHREVASVFPALAARVDKSPRRAWATDTLTDVNGVAATIATAAGRARRRGIPVTVVTSLVEAPRFDFELESFPPVWERALPGYEELALRVPPVLEVVEYLEREKFGEILISTPGPVGLAALLAARLLRVPVSGLYHTDFPRYVLALGGGDSLSRAAGSYMKWFYGQMDRVFVSSAAYRSELTALGLDPTRLRALPRGVDAEAFHPDHRRADFWSDRLGGAGPTFLYVGRLAPEKNLGLLLESFRRVAETEPLARLALVGEGPSRSALESGAHERVGFLGFLDGAELASAYASSDVFVFPSRTDTFGNVVLEAMASGLPGIVAAEGGPAEQARASEAAVIADASDPGAFAAAMLGLGRDPALRRALGRRARAWAERQSWDRLLDELFGPGVGAPACPRETAVAGG